MIQEIKLLPSGHKNKIKNNFFFINLFIIRLFFSVFTSSHIYRVIFLHGEFIFKSYYKLLNKLGRFRESLIELS